MHRIIRIKAYEAEHGPHFNDEHARKAVIESGDNFLVRECFYLIQ